MDSSLTRNDVAALQQAFPARPNAPARYARAEAAVKALNDAGVPILAGTDAPNPGTTHGASIHSELELLVQAGLTPAQALAAATAVPARAFRLADRGTIAPGRRADLVLVDGDPTSDITATRAIHAVWKAGVRFDRVGYASRARATRMVATNAPVDPGVVSTFDDGTTGSRFGGGWMTSNDDIAGGKSTGGISVVDGGAEGSAKALRIAGTVDGSLPYAWSGAMFSPNSTPMQPANLSAAKEIAFFAKGDGQTYRVMVFAQSRGMAPAQRTFTVTGEWKEYTFPWSAFGTDGRDVVMVIVAGGPAAGAFELFIDSVRLK